MTEIEEIFERSFPLITGPAPHQALSKIEEALRVGSVDHLVALRDFSTEALFLLLKSRFGDFQDVIQWSHADELACTVEALYLEQATIEIERYKVIETRCFQTLSYGNQLCVIGCVSRMEDSTFDYKYCAMTQRLKLWKLFTVLSIDGDFEIVERMQPYIDGELGSVL